MGLSLKARKKRRKNKMILAAPRICHAILALLPPDAFRVDVITINSSICQHNTAFSIRHCTEITPYAVYKLPACFHPGIDIHIECSAKSHILDEPALYESTCPKLIPGPVNHIPRYLLVGGSVPIRHHHACRKRSVGILKLPARLILVPA